MLKNGYLNLYPDRQDASQETSYIYETRDKVNSLVRQSYESRQKEFFARNKNQLTFNDRDYTYKLTAQPVQPVGFAFENIYPYDLEICPKKEQSCYKLEVLKPYFGFNQDDTIRGFLVTKIQLLNAQNPAFLITVKTNRFNTTAFAYPRRIDDRNEYQLLERDYDQRRYTYLQDDGEYAKIQASGGIYTVITYQISVDSSGNIQATRIYP